MSKFNRSENINEMDFEIAKLYEQSYYQLIQSGFFSYIPKGLSHSAQRWSAATTLGEPAKWETTLKELWQGMAEAMQPLQG